MARALRTKYHGPTDTKGSRISVYWADRSPANRRYYAWQYELDPGENHDRAIRAYTQDNAITGQWVCGDAGDGNVYVRVSGCAEVVQ